MALSAIRLARKTVGQDWRMWGIKGFVKGATAAASGAIAGAAVILGQGSIVDVPTAVVGLASVLILWRFKIPEPFLIAVAAVIGMLLSGR